MTKKYYDVYRIVLCYRQGSRVKPYLLSVCGLVVEYLVAIEVTRVRFPANAYIFLFCMIYKFYAEALEKVSNYIEYLYLCIEVCICI